uniref:Myosin IH n=1 Tax=Callorhinchus milii TaxID=7868 RepID=A0A4W3J821_CALMI
WGRKNTKVHPRVNMEGALTARDRVGVQDFVLLDSYTSEMAFLDNLRKRFRENLIYTYIGTLLVSVNPYKELEIFTCKQMELYQGVNFFELPPHIYAIADNAYRLMCTEYKNHFILISGESGAGKTEASKKILQYYAMTCPTTEQLQIVRDRLLLSNPVLEAFGNAKTLRNDNSSRFGKYMDIQFSFMGAPVGGHILSYLLEKSRVAHQNHGERNFHIFYQLLEGGENELLRWLGLERNAHQYHYLVQGQCAKVSSINDKNDWKTVRKAFSVIDFNENNIDDLLGIIASVLHLGNIKFEVDNRGHSLITNDTQIRWISKLLGVPVTVLQEALTHKRIETKAEEVLSPLSVEQAFCARDAVAKAIYGRTFTWLVNKINVSLANRDPSRKTVIGLLDIYGFEVFDVNSFEQFCINYCNEKLQQLLIELTLKSEQEEYEAEGIQWEPIQYFNNKIICDLVEERHRGIISILDEECLRPGEATDFTFLMKLEEKEGSHPHFLTHKLADQKTRKTLRRADFRLLHYAGDVTYSVIGFLDKNNDLLYRNLKEVMCGSSNLIVKQCFSLSELDIKKRPETVATQFKNSLMGLMDILMSKEPSYIRCIKPNDGKQAGRFDDVLVRHQVKYLGLMEHLRVRRAGFAYRRKFEIFLQRYKSLCPDTWPHWHGPPSEGVERLVKYIGYKPDEYKMGRTKIFIRFPKTLFATEDAFQVIKHALGEITAELLFSLAFSSVETYWRGILARQYAAKRAWAVKVIKKFIKGFINRKQPVGPENEDFLAFTRSNYLLKLRSQLPKTVLDKSWLKPPAIMEKMQQKAVASAIFKGKKDGYSLSVARAFSDTRLCMYTVKWGLGYGVSVVKYDRNGFRARQRQLLLMQTAAYVVEEAKIKQKIEYAWSGRGEDPHVCVQGDVILQSDCVFETVTKLCVVANKQSCVRIVQGSLKFTIKPGREGTVDFTSGQESQVFKGKNGHLMVVRWGKWGGWVW